MSGEGNSYAAINLTDHELLTIKYLIRTFDEEEYAEDYSPSICLTGGPFDTKEEAVNHIKKVSHGFALSRDEISKEDGY